jgi:hypothetical protein
MACAQDEAPAPASSGHPGPGPSFVMAFICTVLILFIICKPVRKAPS